MSKKTLALFTIFIVTVSIFSSINLFVGKSSSSFPTTLPLPSPTIIPTYTLSLSPNTMTTIPGKSTSLLVLFDATGTPPTLIQLEIGYEPGLLTNVSIQPGDFFPNYNLLLNTINPRTGRISYAIESASGKAEKKAGTIAIITFTPLVTWQKEAALIFLPKTTIRVQNA